MQLPMLNNKAYDVLKWIALILLPALATLYFTLASIWNFPYPDQIVGTIVAIDTFLGVLLQISTNQYNKNMSSGEDYGPRPQATAANVYEKLANEQGTFKEEDGTFNRQKK